MRFLTIIITFALFSLNLHAQTVENIRVEQDGDNLKITYRIGASTENQIFNVIMNCSMDGGNRFEPKAVIGDVGGNIMGGKSYYTIVWDVFKDVDEVVNPEFFVRVELVKDMTPVAAEATRSQTQPEDTEEEAVQETAQETVQEEFESAYEKKDEAEDKDEPDLFERNGFFSFTFSTRFGIPFGITFGSLNNWGYYVTPLRIGIDTYDSWDSYDSEYVTDFQFSYRAAAGVTKHFVSAGIYRLHGYGGAGFHIRGVNMSTDAVSYSYFMAETGIINVLRGFNLMLGLSFHFGYDDLVVGYDGLYYQGSGTRAAFVFGLGFVF